MQPVGMASRRAPPVARHASFTVLSPEILSLISDVCNSVRSCLLIRMESSWYPTSHSPTQSKEPCGRWTSSSPTRKGRRRAKGLQESRPFARAEEAGQVPPGVRRLRLPQPSSPSP